MQATFSKPVSYITRHVDSSIAILDSPEDEVVLDSLIYLSKFADTHVNNLKYLQQRGLVEKLLNLFERDVAILRLSLRLLGILLSLKEAFTEFDQEKYDEQILKVFDMFIDHDDSDVKHLCVFILSRLTESSRITCLIFKIELLHNVLDIIQVSTDPALLEWAIELFSKLLSAPSSIDILPEINFDISILLKYLEHTEKNIVRASFEVIRKLTEYYSDVFQTMFREAELIETMLRVVLKHAKSEYHEIALHIINNNMKCKETPDYFVETLEFLQFCQWVKKCDDKYQLLCISILERLTEIEARRQILFDFSVEDSIVGFLKSTKKDVINKTCKAISNMTMHKYCCEKLLTPTLLKELFSILLRKDKEDPGNEVALKTIFDFSERNINTLDMIHELGAHRILLSYFKRDISFISEESFLGILEILHKMSRNPTYQCDIVSISFFEKLLHLFQTSSATIAAFLCEIIINFVDSIDFRRIFLMLNGPLVFIQTLQSSKDVKLLKNVLFFIYSNFLYDHVIDAFFHHNLVKVLKELPEILKSKMPIADKILKLLYNRYLPLKFFDTNRLDFTDKLGDTFYLIRGRWKGDFPLPATLGTIEFSTANTIYVVDSSFEIKYEDNNSDFSDVISFRRLPSDGDLSMMIRISSSLSSYLRRSFISISYGKLSHDPFLPIYLSQVTKYLAQIKTVEEKVKFLSEYINAVFSKPTEGYLKLDKIHNFSLHVEIVKHKLGSSLIPIGYLRLGRHCERALLFKAIADKCCITASLVKGKGPLYWNEILLPDSQQKDNTLRLYIVDLMNNIGNLLLAGSRAANQYCDLET